MQNSAFFVAGLRSALVEHPGTWRTTTAVAPPCSLQYSVFFVTSLP